MQELLRVPRSARVLGAALFFALFACDGGGTGPGEEGVGAEGGTAVGTIDLTKV
jgi:hypothetical protein